MKITRRQLRRIIKEELYHNSFSNLDLSRNHLSFRGDSRLFERSYITGTLGLSIPLQESYPYSPSFEKRIIHEQTLYENWWGDDWYLFEGAYGELLKTHSAEALLEKLHEGPILDWGKGLLSTAVQKGKEVVKKGIEAGKEALMSAEEGIKKFGKDAWNILSAMWLTMKGGASEIGSWVKSVVRLGIGSMLESIEKALKFLATKLPEWKMPTFGEYAQKGLDFINSLKGKLENLDGWKGVITVSGIAIGLKWLWNKVGKWIDELKEKVGGKFTETSEIASNVAGGIDAAKEWIKETAKEKLAAIGGNAFKKIMGVLASVSSGVKPWWDAAVKVAGGVELIISSLGDAASRFMRINKPKEVQTENIKITRKQLRKIIREVSTPTLQQWANQHNLPIDLDPITGEEVILIDDEFAMRQGIPDGAQWSVERSYDDDGWVVSIPNSDTLGFEEISYGGLDDMDDIEMQVRGY